MRSSPPLPWRRSVLAAGDPVGADVALDRVVVGIAGDRVVFAAPDLVVAAVALIVSSPALP